MIVRDAMADDAEQMADLLNAIVAVGGTTARTEPVSGETVRSWIQEAPERAVWSVACDQDEVLGYQTIKPHSELPPEACDIATFVRIGVTGRGIGRALFDRSCVKAQRLRYTWINANIRSDNVPGLAYYSARGFVDQFKKPGVVLENGQVVEKTIKRFDL